MRLPLLFLIGFVFVVTAEDKAAAYTRAQALSAVNAYRRDPALWDQRMNEAIQAQALPGKSIPWTMYLKDRAPVHAPVPPVYADPALDAVALRLLSETPAPAWGKPIPVDAGAVMPDLPLVALVGIGTSGQWAVLAAAVHCTEEVVQPQGRLHRFARDQLLEPGVTDVGIAIEPVKDLWRVAVVLARHRPHITAGGLAFHDRNGDGVLSAGDHMAKIQVGSPPVEYMGAWSGIAGDRVVVEGQDCVWPEQPSRLWWEGPAPQQRDIRQAKSLLEKVSNGANAEPPSDEAFSLALGRITWALDPATEREVDAVIVPVLPWIDEARKDLVAAIRDDPTTVRKSISDIRRRWNGGGAAWCHAGGLYAENFLFMAEFGRKRPEEKKSEAFGMDSFLGNLQESCPDPELRHSYAAWRWQAELLRTAGMAAR